MLTPAGAGRPGRDPAVLPRLPGAGRPALHAGVPAGADLQAHPLSGVDEPACAGCCATRPGRSRPRSSCSPCCWWWRRASPGSPSTRPSREVFASILDAMWWAIVTMTTVGYGDMVPVTPLGKLVGGLIAVIGLGMVALPAGLLASGFSEQLHQRRREFEARGRAASSPDGAISPRKATGSRSCATGSASPITRPRRSCACSRTPRATAAARIAAARGRRRNGPAPVRPDRSPGRVRDRPPASGGLEADLGDLLDRARHRGLDLELARIHSRMCISARLQPAVDRDHVARQRIGGIAQRPRQRRADQARTPARGRPAWPAPPSRRSPSRVSAARSMPRKTGR